MTFLPRPPTTMLLHLEPPQPTQLGVLHTTFPPSKAISISASRYVPRNLRAVPRARVVFRGRPKDLGRGMANLEGQRRSKREPGPHGPRR
ncbi:hypothetical protein BDN67DRAFT_971258 [Paxillus ammoniavirescens]|nr:hypothetical protein BDN67DRAFT_971258 [Paxillus ammoniavirescens]